MTEMTMNRAIHAAVRRDLDRLEGALRVLSDGDRERVAELVRAWEYLDRELVDHHEKEDELIWPVLEGLGVDHALLAEMESEHGAMREALEQTGEHMTRLGRSATAEDALAAADSVVSTRAVVERHLTHEEQELEPQMLEHRDTPEWKAVERKLRSGGPVRGGWMFAWLLDGGSPEVGAYLRSIIPRPVLLLLARVFGMGYQRRIAPVWRT
jgi:hemerythrin-like domain-containing protein